MSNCRVKIGLIANKVLSYVLLVAVVSTLFFINNCILPRSADVDKRKLFVTDLIDRCRAVRRFYSLPSPKTPYNASKAVADMRSVCERTINVDPLKILRTCGHHPLGVSSKYIEQSDSDHRQAYLVPNVVHYVYNYPSVGSPMTFLMYLSFLSVQRFIQPRYLFIYGVSLPYGHWWNRTTADVDNIYFVNLTSKLPSHVYGKKIWRLAHVADILRLEMSYAIGGIYFDMDVLAFKSFDGLRKYSLTLARESVRALANGIIVCQPCPPFILHWIDNYRPFNPNEWAEHSTQLPNRLARGEAAHLIHVEHGTLLGPTYANPDEMYKVGIKFNWTHQYSTHIYKGYGHVPQSPDEIKHLNSTIGQMMRYVYTGKRVSTD